MTYDNAPAFIIISCQCLRSHDSRALESMSVGTQVLASPRLGRGGRIDRLGIIAFSLLFAYMLTSDGPAGPCLEPP